MTRIASRLNALVEPAHRTSEHHRAKLKPAHRRASYRRGKHALTARVNVLLPASLRARLERVCARATVARSIVIRDALDAYLRVAERDMGLALTWPRDPVRASDGSAADE